MALGSRHDASPRDVGTELVRLVVAYARQETVDPLKTLVRYVVWGVAGAVSMSIGLVLVSLAAVRLLQSQLSTHLRGELSWVPYVGGVLIALAVAGLAVSRVGKRQ